MKKMVHTISAAKEVPDFLTSKFEAEEDDFDDDEEEEELELDPLLLLVPELEPPEAFAVADDRTALQLEAVLEADTSVAEPLNEQADSFLSFSS